MISFKNWKKEGYDFLNKVAYTGLGLVGAMQAADAMGYPLDWFTDKQKHYIVVAVIAFKFIEKMTAKPEQAQP